jgi:hypothetical protein
MLNAIFNWYLQYDILCICGARFIKAFNVSYNNNNNHFNICFHNYHIYRRSKIQNVILYTLKLI